MKEFKIPNKQLLINHLRKYAQYSTGEAWFQWYAKVAPLKGIRVAKTLMLYKDKNSKVLDLGSGIGFTVAMVGQVFPNTIGCEVEKGYKKASEELISKMGLKIPMVLYDGKKLPFKDNFFDAVTFIEVIEHVDDPRGVLKEIRRVLKPDGILHITTANKLWPIEPHFKLPFLSYLPMKLADIYVRISKRGDSYQNIKLPTYNQFCKIVGEYFKVNDITLDIISEFDKYGFGKERGLKVIMLGRILNYLRHMHNMGLIRVYFEKILIQISLGWLFIAIPKKK